MKAACNDSKSHFSSQQVRAFGYHTWVPRTHSRYILRRYHSFRKYTPSTGLSVFGRGCCSKASNVVFLTLSRKSNLIWLAIRRRPVETTCRATPSHRLRGVQASSSWSLRWHEWIIRRQRRDACSKQGLAGWPCQRNDRHLITQVCNAPPGFCARENVEQTQVSSWAKARLWRNYEKLTWNGNAFGTRLRPSQRTKAAEGLRERKL